jgi:predicted RNA-binding protein associated with RNAse of E/G family
VQVFRQELLHDGPGCKITLLLHPPDAPPLPVGEIELAGGGALLWFLFPGRSYEVASVYDPDGRLLGYYTNLLRPPEPGPERWELTDLCLDVWQPVGGDARLLDWEELETAVVAGWMGADEARRVEAEAVAVLRAARTGRWPPRIVRRHPLEAVPAMRFHRDAPGTYYANLVIGRFIAFGMYAFAAVAVTSTAFAALTDAFLPTSGTSLTTWKALIAAEAVVLLLLSLAGRLPATRRPRPEEAITERVLFVGTIVSGLVVLLHPDDRLWRSGLAGLYAVLAFFLGIFAVARGAFDRRTPVLALAGILVSLVALAVLLL